MASATRKRRRDIDDSEDDVLTPQLRAMTRRRVLAGRATDSEDSVHEEEHDLGRSKTSEKAILEELLKAWQSSQDLKAESDKTDKRSQKCFEVDDFTVYCHREHTEAKIKITSTEMCTIQTMQIESDQKTLYLSGNISIGESSRCVKLTPFDQVLVYGYGTSWHSIKAVHIQTREGTKENVWLRLSKPSQEYEKYYQQFLWVATFGKHVVDYLLVEQTVTLHHFRTQFHDWLVEHHGGSPEFQAWKTAIRTTDFRQAFVVYFGWLFHVATSNTTDHDGAIYAHPIWKETNPDANYLTAVAKIDKKDIDPSVQGVTLVTQYVHDCFRRVYFGDQLKSVAMTDHRVLKAWHARKKELGFWTSDPANAAGSKSPQIIRCTPLSVAEGDVIGVMRDLETKWTSQAPVWYRRYITELFKNELLMLSVFVISIKYDEEGPYYQGIWLYEPQDTILSNMYYPFENEFFMSTECNCDPDLVLFRLKDVVAKLEVAWAPAEPPSEGYFVRSTYGGPDDRCFRTFSPADLRCNCDKHQHEAEDVFERACRTYECGDTVLVEVQRGDDPIQTYLEPRVITAFLHEERLLRVRKLLRAKRDLRIDAKQNELVWTEQFIQIDPALVARRCHIRRCQHGPAMDDFPTPYDRDGQADCFLLTTWTFTNSGLQRISLSDRLPMREGPRFDLPNAFEKMDAMSIFCGAGNFDRGLEEAGALHVRWAVDWNLHALHTYRANLKDPEQTNLICSLIDEHLRRALAGLFSKAIPDIGKVDGMIAGFPCPGYSGLQKAKLSEGARESASKVATVCSYVDLYRPKYVILENVAEVATPIGDNNDNIYAQLMCCLVGLGYQVQTMLLGAPAYGEAQRRIRVIIVAVAPGLPMLSEPEITHEYPDYLRGRKLGTTPDGHPFGELCSATPTYGCMTAKDILRGTPKIGDGHTRCCIPFPDHRVAVNVTPREQDLIQTIPKVPHGQGLADVKRKRMLKGQLREWVSRRRPALSSSSSNAYRRYDPHRPLPTITASFCIRDVYSGYGLDPHEDRPVTILVVRRAQGWPDYEVIIGRISDQLRQIGNGVPRAISLALGMSLRKAWLAGYEVKDDTAKQTKPGDTLSNGQ